MYIIVLDNGASVREIDRDYCRLLYICCTYIAKMICCLYPRGLVSCMVERIVTRSFSKIYSHINEHNPSSSTIHRRRMRPPPRRARPAAAPPWSTRKTSWRRTSTTRNTFLTRKRARPRRWPSRPPKVTKKLD